MMQLAAYVGKKYQYMQKPSTLSSRLLELLHTE